MLDPAKLAQLQKEAQASKQSLAAVLVEKKVLTADKVAQLWAEVLQLPYKDLSEIKSRPKAMEGVSRQAASTYRFVAFGQAEGKLQVAMSEPSDLRAREAISFIAKQRGLTPEIHVATASDIDRVLGGSAEVQAEVGGALHEFSKELAEADEQAEASEKTLEAYLKEAPVSKVVAVFIRHAIEGKASDIHVEPAATELRVRYRISGKLMTSLVLPLRVQPAIVSRIKILARLKIDETRLPQDGRFSTTTEGRAYDFRVSVMPTVFGEKVVLRILDKSKGAPSFDELGLIGPAQADFKKNLTAPHGIILISGPTGSGKSTTLFTSLSEINTVDSNISTLEDPVEYDIAGVNQTQIQPDIGLTFASGLRAMLRQDPDIIMVGEIRDQETAALAVHASLTGHLVLSTIHTNDAVSTVPRLIDMGIDPYLLNSTLRVLAAQRLVARLCQNCIEEEPIPEHLQDLLHEELATVPDEYKPEPNQKDPKVFYKSGGCPECQDAGSTGRLAIFEVVNVNRKMREAINNNTGYDTLHDLAREQGHITMRQDGLLKALAGQTMYEDVMRVTTESQE